MTLPRVGITMGDPAGIGPEICVKALADISPARSFLPLIFGNREILERTARQLDIPIGFKTFGETTGIDGITVIDPDDSATIHIAGVESAGSGRASALYIEKAVEFWRAGQIDCMTTAPINKRSLALAEYDFPGHTEFLAYLTQTKKMAMSFFADPLRVVLLSTHLSLANAIKRVRKESIIDLIMFSEIELAKLLGHRPAIAVAGLNPHASDGGMFGSEEKDEIAPAIVECRDKHDIDVSGPYSPDTIFLRGYRGEFDAVIALYHDQATIAVKSLSFGAGVNVTLGLPLVRTSVDHGTAFDIAGKGVANASSLKAAINLAAELTQKTLRETNRQSC